MKQIRWIVTGLILIGVLVFGTTPCNDSVESNKSNININDLANKNEIKNQIANLIRINNIEPFELKVISSDKFNQHIITMFMFYDQSNTLYDGLAHLTLSGSKYKVGNLDHGTSKRETKISFHTASGYLYDDSSEPKDMYISIGGIINDKDIKEVSVLYTDNQSIVIKVDPEYSTFFHTRFENNIYIKEIRGLNENGKEVYYQKWYS